MLTCAVCGDIFASPSCANIIKAIEEIYSDSGVIVIVKNYQGDIINLNSLVNYLNLKINK